MIRGHAMDLIWVDELYYDTPPGYWCVICQRLLPADKLGVIVHDAIAHPITMTFDEEEKPQ